MLFSLINGTTPGGVLVRAAGSRAADGCTRLARRAHDRLSREQTGQDILEYAGLLVLVAIVVIGIISLGLPSTVAHAVANAVNGVFTSNHTYTAPQPVKVGPNVNSGGG